MNMEIVRSFLMWSSIINYALLILWFVLFAFGHDSLKKLCEFAFRRKFEQFDSFNIAGISLYKMMTVFFNVMPWVVLSIIR